MKNFLIATLAFLAISCAHKPHKERDLSSTNQSLSGTYLGEADYDFPHRGPNSPAVRLYFQELEDQPGHYNAIVLEYVNLLGMVPQFGASQKLPALNKLIGYLTYIVKRLSVYRVSPSGKEGVFTMQRLKVVGKDIVVDNKPEPSQLILSKEDGLNHPLENAKITTSTHGEIAPIIFPAEGDQDKYGHQYRLAKYGYESKKLDSTWRKNYLPGPYLSAYAKKEDVVLKLKIKSGQSKADFVLNPDFSPKVKRASNPRQRRAVMLAKQRRKSHFTNGKSAFIEGKYSVTEPLDGMFLFHGEKGKHSGKGHVEGRIGLFIDIFDNSKNGQDVVELALVNTKDPEDFLMYYEHPDNGEGEDYIED